jgi:hypothetical protein
MTESAEVAALIDVIASVLGHSEGRHVRGQIRSTRLTTDATSEISSVHRFWVSNQGRGGWSIEDCDHPGIVDLWILGQDHPLRSVDDSVTPSPRAAAGIPIELELLAPSTLHIWGREGDFWRPTNAVREEDSVRLTLRSNREDMHGTRELVFSRDAEVFTESITFDATGAVLQHQQVEIDDLDGSGYAITTDISFG